MDIRFISATKSSTSRNFISDFFPRRQLHNYYKINVADMRYMFLLFVQYYNISTQVLDKMPMGT
jgi:hypothetical protein